MNKHINRRSPAAKVKKKYPLEDNELHKGIASRLKQLREILRMSPQQMAVLIGIKEELYQDIEGLKTVIGTPVYYKISKSLGISLDWLISGNGPMYENKVIKLPDMRILHKIFDNTPAVFYEALPDNTYREKPNENL